MVAGESGTIIATDTQQIGIASMLLGAGREKKESEIDFSAGIKMVKKLGDQVQVGDTIAILYSNQLDGICQAEKLIKSAYKIKEESLEEEKLIIARVTKDGVTWY